MHLCDLCGPLRPSALEEGLTQRSQRYAEIAEKSYSYRSATSGSTCVARRAGIKHASNAAPSATRNTSTYAAGSDAETPNNMLDIQRVNTKAAPSPITAPINVSAIPFPITILRIEDLCAPSAMRMPISCVRKAIE